MPARDVRNFDFLRDEWGGPRHVRVSVEKRDVAGDGNYKYEIEIITENSENLRISESLDMVGEALYTAIKICNQQS